MKTLIPKCIDLGEYDRWRIIQRKCSNCLKTSYTEIAMLKEPLTSGRYRRNMFITDLLWIIALEKCKHCGIRIWGEAQRKDIPEEWARWLG